MKEQLKAIDLQICELHTKKIELERQIHLVDRTKEEIKEIESVLREGTNT